MPLNEAERVYARSQGTTNLAVFSPPQGGARLLSAFIHVILLIYAYLA